jgi:Tfp pilus assembly protein PilF
VFSCGAISSFGQGLLDQAKGAFDELDLAQAKDLLASYEDQHGTNAATLYLSARINIIQGRLQHAREVAITCQQQFRQDARCYEAKGESELIRLLLQGNILSKVGAAR